MKMKTMLKVQQHKGKATHKDEAKHKLNLDAED